MTPSGNVRSMLYFSAALRQSPVYTDFTTEVAEQVKTQFVILLPNSLNYPERKERASSSSLLASTRSETQLSEYFLFFSQQRGRREAAGRTARLLSASRADPRLMMTSPLRPPSPAETTPPHAPQDGSDWFVRSTLFSRLANSTATHAAALASITC